MCTVKLYSPLKTDEKVNVYTYKDEGDFCRRYFEYEKKISE